MGVRREVPDRDAAFLAEIHVEEELFHAVADQLCEALLAPGHVVFLGGGRAGAEARRLVRRVAPQGRLIVVETAPEVARRLTESLAADGHAGACQVFNAALHNERGRIALMQLRNGLDQALAEEGLEIPPPPWHYDPDIAIWRTDALLIDDFLAHDPATRFIRLDLVGAEFPALVGGARTLRLRRPVVLFDHGGSPAAARYDYDAGAFFDFFGELDYDLVDLLGRPFGFDEWDRMPAPWHLLALPAGTRQAGLALQAVRDVVARLAKRERWRAWRRWALR